LHFCELNTALWVIEGSTQSKVAADHVALIDLLSHDFQHTLHALYVGRVLRQHTNCKLVGVVGTLRFSTDLCLVYNKENAIRLAQSYGVTDFLDLESADAAMPSGPVQLFSRADTSSAIESIRGCPDQSLSDLVLGWRAPNGSRIGEYIYETVLRIARDPFLENSRSKIEEVIIEAHQIYNAIAGLRSSVNIDAYASGHMCYTQWGLVADMVLREGGKAIYCDCIGNFSAYLLTRPPKQGETLDGLVRQINNELFEREFRDQQRPDPRFVSKIQKLFSSDYFLRPFWWEPTKAPSVEFIPALSKIARAKLGWRDERPIVCVFMHCLSDVPRNDEQIYRDYYQWVLETLKIAERDNSKYWIFKTHPANRGGYDVTNTTEDLKQRFKSCEHIFFLDDELDKIEIFAICDLTVTVRGSIAYEMALFGKPVLLAGRSASSDMGFTHVAHTAAEYENLLTTDFSTLTFSHEMQERVNFYLIYDKIIYRIESTFVPYWTYTLTGSAVIWDQLSERILYNISDLDPAASAIKAMLDGGSHRTLNVRYRQLPASPASTPELPMPEGPVTLTRGNPLSFGRDGNGRKAVLSKSARAEDHGVWFDSNRRAFIGFLFDANNAEGAEGFVVRLKIFGALDNAVLHMSLNGGPRSVLLLHGGGTQDSLTLVNGDSGLKRNALNLLEVWMTTAIGAEVAFRLDEMEVSSHIGPARGQPDKAAIRDFVSESANRPDMHAMLSGSYPLERTNGKEFIWVRQFAQARLWPLTLSCSLVISGFIPFALHHERHSISTFSLAIAVNGERVALIETSADTGFNETIDLSNIRARSSEAIRIDMHASSVLGASSADARDLSFIVTEFAVQWHDGTIENEIPDRMASIREGEA
jgi:hypothetical protein